MSGLFFILYTVLTGRPFPEDILYLLHKILKLTRFHKKHDLGEGGRKLPVLLDHLKTLIVDLLFYCIRTFMICRTHLSVYIYLYICGGLGKHHMGNLSTYKLS